MSQVLNQGQQVSWEVTIFRCWPAPEFLKHGPQSNDELAPGTGCRTQTETGLYPWKAQSPSWPRPQSSLHDHPTLTTQTSTVRTSSCSFTVTPERLTLCDMLLSTPLGSWTRLCWDGGPYLPRASLSMTPSLCQLHLRKYP